MNGVSSSTAASGAAADPLEARLAAAQVTDPENSDFDYIIVGSGAGGGPLAARLALAGKKVLVLEAGRDPVQSNSLAYPTADKGEVTRIPGYYAAASEDKEMSWMFSVRHHADDATQKKDEKYNNRPWDPDSPPEQQVALDPKYLDPHPRGGKQGIFYPRSSGIGGCTAHHAMITIAPNDKDWNDIADLTGDESWRAGPMRGYFAKFERNQYLAAYDRFLSHLLGFFYRIYRWAILLFDPRAVLDRGGHGFDGWAPTNFIDPFLISTIAKADRPFFRVIVRAALGVLHGNNPLLVALKRAALRLRVVQAIDFNDVNTRRTNPEGVFLIPIGTESGTAPDDSGQPGTGCRFGVREFLLTTAAQHPERLVIKTGVHVTRVLFEQRANEEAPRAIGVECAVGDHLYEASPAQKSESAERVAYFARAAGGEVVLCGGAFNTPQLLMLSGIGDRVHLGEIAAREKDPATCVLHAADGEPLLDGKGNHRRINLPGVGCNLQDRYEVTVVSELAKDFTTLDSVSFLPGDPQDLARRQWRESRTGLYSTNGGTLAVIRRSKPAVDAGTLEPDLFTFGAPAAFRGYYWNWSREVFKPTLGAPDDAHRLWSWVILKGYTRNRGGTVRLRSGSPFDMPEICFDVFNEGAEQEAQKIQRECQPYHDSGAPLPFALAERKRKNDEIVRESRRDLAAMVDAVSFMRKVNARNPEQFVREIQPGVGIEDDSAAMEEWIKTQAWGHHCSCTCRIGSDKWREDPGQLQDREAVLSSDFRVHGVNGLRIVDASIFPKIPGYFILAPIFMASEKAADTLLQTATSAVYPSEFEAMEAAAIRRRREKARLEPNKTVAARSADRIPGDTVGLALSGGGIRSATFALGMLQTLARRNRLREIDLLSTVSGGGFIGSFLGRLFTRPSVHAASDPCGRVQEKLADTSSAPVWWLRTQANYIFATGTSDLQQNLAVFLRNIIAVHLVLGTLLFTFFGLLAWLPETVGVWVSKQIWFRLFEGILTAPRISPISLSAWWWTPLAVLVLALLPTTFGFWLAPKDRSYRPYPFFALLAWLVLLGGALFGLQIPHVTLFAVGGGLILLLSWCWQEVARWGASENTDNGPAALHPSVVLHNRLSRWLGVMVFIFAALVGWVILDTLAAYFATSESVAKKLAALMVLLAPALPVLQSVATRAKQALSKANGGMFSVRTARWFGLPLVILLCGIVDLLAHRLFVVYPGNSWGLVVLGFTFVFSLAVGRAFDFLNLSSLHATYAARLVRTFQGASNEDRVYASSSSGSKDIKLAHPKDDVPLDQYHPEEQGGPLHFINVCVNETVDFASDRDVRERKGLPMCVTPHGVSVGRRYFAEWTGPDQWPRWQKIRRWINGMDGDDSKPLADRRKIALKALPVSSDPNAFHVLKTKGSASAESEALSLGAWTAISGAAFSTGRGRATDLGLSAFMGLANVRLGYWWDSGVREQDRPGRYPSSIWRMFRRFPITLFRMQSLLVSEWRGRYHGASRWFWYLSDGGHFEVTGLYELLRRRVPFMIVSDAGEDPSYRWSDIALLTQQTREDFGAQIEWVNPNPADKTPRLLGWAALPGVPEWIQKWIRPHTIGALSDLSRDGQFHAALARVTYGSARTPESWILLLKPGVGAGLTEDIVNYGAENNSFPQQPTFDQIFDDIQWESYRALGEQIADEVLAD